MMKVALYRSAGRVVFSVSYAWMGKQGLTERELVLVRVPHDPKLLPDQTLLAALRAAVAELETRFPELPL